MDITRRLLREFVEFDRERVVQLTKANIDWSGGEGEQVIEQYCYDNDLDIEEDGENIDIDSPEFLDWFRGFVSDNYNDAEFAIENSFENGEITLWRAITAPRNWKPDPNRHPGIYWSWDFRAAEAHWGDFRDGSIVWILETKVHADAIDWEATLAQNAQPSYVEEKEVRLKEGYPVKILDYYEDFKLRKTMKYK